MTKVLEGTWEEIAAHASEWKGHKLRITVLDAPDSGEETEKPTLSELLGDVVGSVDGLPDDLGGNHKKYYAQAMDEKAQRDAGKAEAMYRKREENGCN